MNNDVVNKSGWVLVVEDERPLARAVQDAFTEYNTETVTAKTCRQALQYIAEIPDCKGVWLDHYLPDNSSGLDFIVELRTLDAYKSVPVFVVSNSGMQETKHSYLALGAIEYFVKSDVSLREIVKTMTSHIKED